MPLIVIGFFVIIFMIVSIIKLIELKHIRNTICLCGYFTLDSNERLKITEEANDISAGFYDYLINKNIKDYIANFDFKKIDIIRFASGLKVDEFGKYLELKYKNKFPIVLYWGFKRGNNIFSKLNAFDKLGKKDIEMERTHNELFTFFTNKVLQIGDFYAIGELIALNLLIIYRFADCFLAFDLGDKKYSIGSLTDLDFFVEYQRKYFKDKIDKKNIVDEIFDRLEFMIHEQKAYYYFQVQSDFNKSLNEIEKCLLAKLHSYLDDQTFINFLTEGYCAVINAEKMEIEAYLENGVINNYDNYLLKHECEINTPLMFLSCHLTHEIKDFSAIRSVFEKLLNKYGEDKIIFYFYGLALYKKAWDTKSRTILAESIRKFNKALKMDSNFVLAKNKKYWSEFAEKTNFKFYEVLSSDQIKSYIFEQCKIFKEFEDYFLSIGVDIRINK